MEFIRKINGLEVNALYSEESIQNIFLPLLKRLTGMQKELNRRIIVMLAAPPAAGKSTLVSFLQYLSEITPEVTPVTAIGMDGFHRYQDYLLNHTTIRNGEEILMVKVKGAPETFDLEALTQRIQRLISDDVCPWPEYSRTIHNPVEGAIQVQGDIVLIEGNYLLLDLPGWKELKQLADYTISIRAKEADLRERLINRKQREGVNPTEAVKFVDSSDLPNARLCIAHTAETDLILNLEKDGTYTSGNK